MTAKELNTTKKIMENVSKENFESRIIKLPQCMSWKMGDGQRDGFNEYPTLNYEGLSDAEKMALFIYSYSRIEIGVGKRSIHKEFNWTDYYISKIRKELDKFVETITLFSDDDGLISGKGYILCFE